MGMTNMSSFEKRIKAAEQRAGADDNGIQVIRMIFDGTDSEPEEVHYQPVSRQARERAERLAKKHGHAFKVNWIPAAIWEGAE